MKNKISKQKQQPAKPTDTEQTHNTHNTQIHNSQILPVDMRGWKLTTAGE